MKAELKITPDQERGLKANDGQREKIWHRHVQELAKVTPGQEVRFVVQRQGEMKDITITAGEGL